MLKLRPTPFILAASDLLALLAACTFAYALRTLWPGELMQNYYTRLIPVLLFFIPLYTALNLYPGLTIPMPDFLKKTTTATSLGFLFLSALLFLSQRSDIYSRMILSTSWFFALFSVPLFRYVTERLFSCFPWWGYPVIIFGDPGIAGAYAGYLQHNKHLGFTSLAVCSDKEPPAETKNACVRLAASSREIKKQMRELKKGHQDTLAVIIMDKLPMHTQHKLFLDVSDNFSKILLVPESTFNIRLSIRLADFCGHMALSLRQSLLDPYKIKMKRLVDIILSLVMLPFIIPAILTIYIIVRLDSPGPGFYRQTRLGYGGREIRIWKFRTMYNNSAEMLKKLLAENPDIREEWEKEQKIRKDPRITRAGRLLRKFSLDELPQIINIFSGDMSLVGPRPIIAQEIPRYGAAYSTYMKVKPGLTGLWQVSGRNDVSYATRVSLDEYYIANWSVWLDIYILARTAPAALRTGGAY